MRGARFENQQLLKSVSEQDLIQATIKKSWKSKESDLCYPISWELVLHHPKQDSSDQQVVLEIDAAKEDQELFQYWEGAITGTVEGLHELPETFYGCLELTDLRQQHIPCMLAEEDFLLD